MVYFILELRRKKNKKNYNSKKEDNKDETDRNLYRIINLKEKRLCNRLMIQRNERQRETEVNLQEIQRNKGLTVSW